jgi:hypothetical protein
MKAYSRPFSTSEGAAGTHPADPLAGAVRIASQQRVVSLIPPDY